MPGRGALCGARAVLQRGFESLPGDARECLDEERSQSFDKTGPGFDQPHPMGGQRLLETLQEQGVRARPERLIAGLERASISDHVREVRGSPRKDRAIEKTPPCDGRRPHEPDVVGGEQNDGEDAEVVPGFARFVLPPALAVPQLDSHLEVVLEATVVDEGLHCTARLAEAHELAQPRSSQRSQGREPVNRLEQVRFPLPVFARENVEVFVELQPFGFEVPEPIPADFTQVHGTRAS